jgi:acetyl esterase/lipase
MSDIENCDRASVSGGDPHAADAPIDVNSGIPVGDYEETPVEATQTVNGARQEISMVGLIAMKEQADSRTETIQNPGLGTTNIAHLVQTVILPSRVMFSAIRIPFKIALTGRRRRPTWSTEMEVVMSAFRSACRHAPRDLNLLRIMTDLEVPEMLLPKGARIHQTRLQGMLIEWVFPHSITANETSSQSIFTNAQVREWSTYHPIVLYLHGGGYALCSSQTHRNILTSFAVHDVVLCVPNYRRAPDVSIIEAVEDCFSTYRHLVEVIGVDPARIAIMGDSAGGALAVLTLCRIRDEKSLALPACGVLLSPWCELEDSKINLEAEKGNIMPEHDYLPRDVLVMISRLVRGDLSPEDPRINPMSADLTGLPKILIHVGELELLFEQITRFYDKLKDDGIDVKMKIWIDGVHVPHAFTVVFDEARLAVKDAATFIRQNTGL